MTFHISGIGCQAPEFSLDQASMAEVAVDLCSTSENQSRLLRALYERSLIQKRSSVLLDETAGEPRHDFYSLPSDSSDRGPGTQSRMSKYEAHAGRLTLKAARQALQSAGLSPTDLTHLITVSCTGFYAPGLDFQLIEGLGLNRCVGRIQIGFMGCHAVLNALRVASALADSNPKTQILIASVELCSLHFQYGWDPDNIVSNALFSDGAAALVGGSQNGSKPGSWRLAASGSYLLPDSAEAMTWKIGNHGFVMTLSRRVPELIEQNLSGWLDHWLAQSGFRREQVRSWAVHPGGPRVLKTVERSLGIGENATRASRQVLSRHGNMSSATLIFILRELEAMQAELPCVALGFGPGLTIEAALFT